MNRNLTIYEEIILNQFSQRIYSLDEMNKWFCEYTHTDKKNIVQGLLNMVIQSGATVGDIYFAASYLRKTASPSSVKLLDPRKPFAKFGYEICDLPEKELCIGFSILLLTLSVADNRRKLSELPDTCSHWWHKDLSDKEYLKKVVAGL